MKKLFCLLLFAVSVLTACYSSASSFSEVESVPSDVQQSIHSDYRLQLINDGENRSYLVFHSKGKATADMEAQGDTITIKLEEANQPNGAIEQHVYKLTKDPEHEVIDVHINGESASIDNVTSL